MVITLKNGLISPTRKVLNKPAVLRIKLNFIYLTHTHTYIYIYTGLFISPSGISELDCATTKTDTAQRSISVGR